MSQLIDHPNLETKLLNLFGPWTCCCINSGGQVVSSWHVDSNNYAGGFCVVIPFDHFDYRRSARLVIDLGQGQSVAFELPPGIPFFLPSSLLAHYNTRLTGGDRRGSMVFWNPGSVMEWLALGGRAKKDLTPAELQKWLNGLQVRAATVLQRYPTVPFPS